VLQTVSAGVTNLITLQSNAAYTLPPEQQPYLTVEIMPGSLIGMDGHLRVWPSAIGHWKFAEGAAPPGTKLNFLSFDHTTGRLVIEGHRHGERRRMFVKPAQSTQMTNSAHT
jgi:hypothetical protein